MVEIPFQLQKEDLRFVLIQPKTKRPFENDWQNKGYKFNDPKLIEHLSNGGNYGIIGGYGKLRFIDCDNKEFAEEMKKKLPLTFTVKTGSGGNHLYFFSGSRDNAESGTMPTCSKRSRVTMGKYSRVFFNKNISGFADLAADSFVFLKYFKSLGKKSVQSIFL